MKKWYHRHKDGYHLSMDNKWMERMAVAAGLKWLSMEGMAKYMIDEHS
jgi:ribonuclease HI